ncbi:ABC transporter permease [Janibacter sp. G56]|uniref:ABC transporter permease n=1 Tax=Janibacter sp. G56 TaxID=3418717 RepID=UPI003CFD64EB
MSTGLSVGTETVPERHATRRGRSPLFWAAVAVVAVFVIAIVRVITGVNVGGSGVLIAAFGLAVPIALAGLGGLWSERAGVVNIGLEGMMILGTWSAAFGAIHFGPWGGVLGAIIGGVVGGAVHAVATVYFGVDHIVSGVALNIIALGVAKYLASRFFSDLPGGGPTQSPPLDRLPAFTLPGVSPALGDLEAKEIFFVSDLAGVLKALCTNLNVLTIIAVLLFVATYVILWRTAFGLRLRSVGEAPHAAETLGINVYRYKFYAVLASGALAGLGGGFLALVAANVFRDGQTGGRGYIGLAAMIFGNWRPGGLLAGSALFGFTDATQLRGGGEAVHALLVALAILLVLIGIWQIVRSRRILQGAIAIGVGALVALWWTFTDSIPGELSSFAPHLTTLLVLAFASQRLRMPAADGVIYRKGEGS